VTDKLKHILKEPLLHFLVLGGLLFVLFPLVSDDKSPGDKTIVVTPGQVEQLVARFQRTWLRPPTQQEIAGLIEDHVRDEVYYREALALGLDRDDPQVRQRMRVKLEFLLEDMTAEEPASDAALAVFLEQHADLFRVPPRIGLRQVFLNPDRHADLAADAGSLLAELRAGAAPEELGDPGMLMPEYTAVYPEEIARTFGAEFAQRVAALPTGEWTGPIDSPLGVHLVQVTQRREAYLPELAEIRAEVEREYELRRRRELKQHAYQMLRQRYEVVIEPAMEADAGTGRALTAVRSGRTQQ
jgi:hypothetical protein